MTEIEKNIVELLKEGYYLKEISEKLQKDYNEILDKKKKIMEEGNLTQEDIIKRERK